MYVRFVYTIYGNNLQDMKWWRKCRRCDALM